MYIILEPPKNNTWFLAGQGPIFRSKLQTKKPLTTCQTKVKRVRTAKKCKSASRFDHPVVWVFLIWSHSHMGPQNTANLTQQKGWRKERYIWPIDVQSMAGITLRSCRPSAGTSQKCRLHREIFGVFFDDWRPVDLGPFAEVLQQETPTGRDYSWMVHASNNQKSQWSQVHAPFQPTYGISMGFSISLCSFRAATPSHSAVRSEFFCTTVTVVVPGCVAKLA